MGHLILADLRRHPARTLLTGLGVAIGVATIVALLALSAGIERSAAGLVNLGGAELGVFQDGAGEQAAGVFVVLALVIGGIAVMNTMLMAVFERRREFALLLAVGWPRRMVAELVEAWALARAVLVAAAMGAAGSLYPAWWVSRLRVAEALG